MLMQMSHSWMNFHFGWEFPVITVAGIGDDEDAENA